MRVSDLVTKACEYRLVHSRKKENATGAALREDGDDSRGVGGCVGAKEGAVNDGVGHNSTAAGGHRCQANRSGR